MISVTCAIIIHNSKILLCQRSEKMNLPLKWEFPGGKLEPHESEQDCLTREIKEELNLEIIIVKRLTPIEHHYDTFTIRLIPFTAQITQGDIQLTEDKTYAWVSKEDLLEYDLAPADIPIVHELLKIWN